MGLPLAAFLLRTNTRPATVARATGLHISTVTRVRDGKGAHGKTVELLNQWAEGVADALELRAAERLSWDHLLEGERRAGGGAA